MEKEENQPVNMLHGIHKHFIAAPILFREAVCQQTKMSVPDFYRKMRIPDGIVGEGITCALTNTEKVLILKQAKDIVKKLDEDLGIYPISGL